MSSRRGLTWAGLATENPIRDGEKTLPGADQLLRMRRTALQLAAGFLGIVSAGCLGEGPGSSANVGEMDDNAIYTISVELTEESRPRSCRSNSDSTWGAK